MTIGSLATAAIRFPSITLRLAGRRITRVLRARTSHAYGASGIGGGTVVIREPPVEPNEGDAITWTWGFQDVEVAGFTGYVTRVIDNSYPATWELEVQDVLWLAQREQGPIAGGASPYNNITANAAITYILNAVGLTRLSLPTIARPSTGGTWTLGQLTPVRWERTTALAAAQEIAATAGYWLYADAGGTVRAVAIERRPSSSPLRTFTRGVDLLVDGAPVRTRDGSQVRNRVTVRGASTGVEGAQLFDTFSATHAVYPGVTTDLEVEFPLLEYIADVTAVASRLTALWNRRPSVITARIKADPRLRVGATVAIQDSGIGHRAAQSYFVYQLDTEFDGATGRFDQRITLDGGTGSAGYTEIPAPVAVIRVRILERETLSGGTAISILEVDGTGSYSLSGGEIVSYAWTIADTPYSGTASSASTATATFIIPDSEAPFSVSLTVTDTSSKTGTASADVPLAGDAGVIVSTEAVIAAAGSAVEYTPDGGATWREEVRTVTIAAESAGVRADAPAADAATYGALFASGTEVRQTLDGLTAASTVLNTAGGSLAALHTNARNGARVWRAVGTALSRSIDGGTTWAAWGTLPATVRDIIEDPALDNSVFVLAGANMYHSTSATAPGTSWATLYAGPSGATARWFVRSDDGAITWIAYTGASPYLQRVETGAAASGPSTAIRALALIQTDPANILLVAVDSATPPQVWIGPATTGVLTAGPTLPSGATAQHATGSRQFPGAYIADFDSVTSGTGAIRKLIAQGTGVLLPWRTGATGRQYHMAQLAAEARSAGRVLAQSYGTATPGVWEYLDGTWAYRSAGLPSATLYGFGVVANPGGGGNEWLAVFHSNTSRDVTTSGGKVVSSGGTYSPLWYWNGLTWAEVEIDDAAVVSGTPRLFGVEWLESGGAWVTAIANPLSPYYTSVIRGAAGSVTGISSSGTLASVGIPFATAGRDNDAVLTATVQTTGGDRVYYQASGGAVTEPAGGSAGDITPPGGRVIVAPTGRQAVMLNGGALWATSDYRSAQPANRSLGTLGGDVTWATHGVYLARQAPGGLFLVTNPVSGTISAATVDASYDTTLLTALRSDAQTRSLVAAIDVASLIIVYNGSSMTRIGLPAARAELADAIEVIG